MSIKSKIQALITAANSKTGEADETLTDAVQTLVDGYGGITPTGNINITDTNVTDVTNYATAQVVDADLIASNIKKDVNILGVVGSFEGGGGGGFLHETGTLSVHTGTNNRALNFPVSDTSYSHYICRFRAVKSWRKIDGVWTEQETLDFTGATSAATAFIGTALFDLYFARRNYKDVNGTDRATSVRQFGYMQGSTLNAGYVESIWSIISTDKQSGILVVNSSNPYVCTATFGLTYEYDIVGWND